MSRIETDLIVRAVHEGFAQLQGELQKTGKAAESSLKPFRDLDEAAEGGAAGLAVLQQRASLIQGEMKSLAREVAKGNISLNDAEREYEELAHELGRVESAMDRAGSAAKTSGQDIKQSGLKWTELRSAVALARETFQTVQQAAQRAYDALKEGAAMEAAEGRFGRLAESIGTTATALETDLDGAVRGMMTNAEAMGLAGDLMSLGLAKTHDQAVRLTRVASALNMDMNQLTLTLSNRTTMRFDSLGVAVDGFSDRLSDLEAQGMSTNDAFTEGFLQQAEAQIEKVGDAADTTAGKLQILENRAKEAGDVMRRNFLESMTPTIDKTIEWVETTDMLEQAMARGIITVEEHARLNVALARGFGDVVQAEIDLARERLEGSDVAWERVAAEDALRRAMSDGQISAEEYRQMQLEQNEGYQNYIRILEEAEQKQRDVAASAAAIEEGRRTLTYEVDTQTAEEEIEGFILEWQGKQINIGLNIQEETAGGGLPSIEEGATGIAGDILEDIQVERRYIIAAEAELDEKKWRQEMMDLRPQLEEAIMGEMGISDSPLGADFEIPIAPSVQRQQMVDDMEAGLIDVQTLIDDNPLEIAPDVDQTELDDMVSFLDSDVQGAIDGVFGTVHTLETTDNLPVLDMNLQNVLNKVNAIAGTHHVRFVYGGGTGASGGGQGGIPTLPNG